MQIDTFREDHPPVGATGHMRRLTIIAQDPSVSAELGILTAEVSVPVDRLEPGPRSHRFHVVDYDASSGQLVDPVPDLRDPRAAGGDYDWSCRDGFPRPDSPEEETERYPGGYRQRLVSDPAFRAQNVYAIAARTLAAFEFALGRRIEWEFDSHQLYIVPWAFADANAHYSREDRGLFFGYVPRENDVTFQTCLSHDIVCHETTHAILDGLRPRFFEPTLPDQPAFHEALGDIVAILSVFSLPEAVESALGRKDPEDRITTRRLERAALGKGILFGLAEEFGEVASGVRGSALRRSRELAPGDWWRSDPAFEEPHRRGEVLVAAVIDALTGMWSERLEALEQAGGVNRERAAEEGATAAGHLMTMVIRSLDYAPAVEIEFEDVLDALLVADEIIAPDDRHGYREALRASFERYGIHQPEDRTIDLAQHGGSFRYEQINAAALRSSKDEAYRFLWQNLGALGLRSDWHLEVESLRPAVRVGPDGLVIQEVVCDYIQMVEMTAGQARQLADREEDPATVMRPQGEVPNRLTVPPALADNVQLQLWGGGTVIFDQFGRAKLHQHKDLDDWARQSERLSYLLGKGLFDSERRLGFSYGASAGMAIADLHAPDVVAGQAW